MSVRGAANSRVHRVAMREVAMDDVVTFEGFKYGHLPIAAHLLDRPGGSILVGLGPLLGALELDLTTREVRWRHDMTGDELKRATRVYGPV